MIKSEVIYEEKPDIRVYPYLGRYKDEDIEYIVLFTSKKVGVVVNSNYPLAPVGKSYAFWDEGKFEIYKGKVVLENE